MGISSKKSQPPIPAWLPGSLAILIAVTGAMIVIGYALLLFAPPNATAQPDTASILLHSIEPALPKPGDRFMFFGLLVALPLVLGAAAAVARGRRGLRVNVEPVLWALVAVFTLITLWLGVTSSLLFAHHQWIWTGTCFITAAIIVLRGDRQISRRAILWIGFAMAALLTAGLRLWTVHNIQYDATYTSHYEAVISTPVRIAGGGTCLADVIGQYGCYGEFIAPLLRILGSSTLAVTSIFVALQIVSIWAVLVFSRSVIRTPPLLLACILCLFIEAVLDLTAWSNDPILQYYPLRFFFPSLSLLVFGWLQQRWTWRRAALAGMFSGAAIAWNLESGLAVSIALGLFVTLGDLNNPAWQDHKRLMAGLQRVLTFAFGTAGFIVAFLLYLQIKSVEHIDITSYFIFQKTFYFTGFGMILIPPFPHYWTIHAGIILAALTVTALCIGTRTKIDPELEKIAFLAVLAIGLTLYYSGRSHPLVLKLAAWPDAILFLFLADQAMRSANWRRPLMLLQVAVIALPAAYLVAEAPAIWKTVVLPRLGLTQPSEVEQDIAFITLRTQPGERIAIVALNQGTLYGETGTRPALRGPGIAEMIRKVDLADEQEDIIAHGPQKLFLGMGLEKAAENGKTGTDIDLNFAKLRTKYAFVGWGPGSRLMYLRRKPGN